MPSTACGYMIGLLLLAPPAPAEGEKPPKTGVVSISDSLRMDFDHGQVIVDAKVVLTEGPLELLLCPFRTKEHESILAADIAPRSFQLALLGIGAQPGAPAQFDPDFAPARGQEISIEVEFEKEGKTVRASAWDWIRPMTPRDQNADEKPTPPQFIFAGSRFIRVPGENRARWLGDDGDLVCVANFPGSIVDVSIRSDNANASLLFEAWTERIPPRDTPVRVIFTPKPAEPEKK